MTRRKPIEKLVEFMNAKMNLGTTNIKRLDPLWGHPIHYALNNLTNKKDIDKFCEIYINLRYYNDLHKEQKNISKRIQENARAEIAYCLGYSFNDDTWSEALQKLRRGEYHISSTHKQKE